MSETLLQTEKLVHSLADELLKLKSAVEQYEENRKSLDAVRESMQRIGVASTNLAENTKSFLVKFDKMGLEQKLSKLQEDSSKLTQNHSQQAKKMKLTQTLVFILLTLQAATIVTILLKK